jgi:hypothetical protein
MRRASHRGLLPGTVPIGWAVSTTAALGFDTSEVSPRVSVTNL